MTPMHGEIPVSEEGYNFDGWADCKSGAHPARGISVMSVPLSPMQLERMFENDWLTRKVCERPAKDATRKGIVIQEENEEEIKDILEKLKVFPKTRTAVSWARLFGGAALILIVDDGKDSREPLDYADVDKVIDVLVVDRNNLAGEDLDQDVMSLRYLLPVTYRITGGAAFHISRMCIFIGADTTYNKMRQEQGWGSSVVRAAYDAIRDFGFQMQDLRHLIHDSSLGVLKMPNLTNKVIQGGNPLKATMYRADAFNSSKSIYRTAVIDSEEEFTYVNRSFAGLSDVTTQFMTVVSGATEMPQLVLFGTTPGGLNASQDEQLDTYYDMVNALQEEQITPAYNKILLCITQGKQVTWEYMPLAQLSDAKKADVRLKEAQAAEIVQRIAQLNPEAGAKLLNETGHFDIEIAPENEGEETLPDELNLELENDDLPATTETN